MLKGILKTPSSLAFAITSKKAEIAALDQRITQRLASVNNRPVCIKRTASRELMKDCKQVNNLRQQLQQSQQKQVRFAAALTDVGLSPSQTAHHSNKL
ncbi:hypothetical protein [Yersinia mollaretii]|uniref:hypothetical protein n=1 Tax=Yersinia mollaretii TaxID=33060 RepID=UPI0011AA6CC3|nr:hypothetical protein [Yersinia mollaretii]